MITDLFTNPGHWESAAAVSPPPFFTEDAGYYFSTDGAGVGDRSIHFVGDLALLPGTYSVSTQVTGNPLAQALYLSVTYATGGPTSTINFSLSEQLGTVTASFDLPTGITAFALTVWQDVSGVFSAPTYFSGLLLSETAGMNEPVVVNGGSSDYNRVICYNAPVDYNNGRFLDPRDKTLNELITDLLRRLGYSATAASPAPGVYDELRAYLQDANEQLYERYPQLRRQRWMGWQTQVGQRFYDVPIDCVDYLDLRKITWAGVQNDQQWYPLWAGIDPLLYNQTFNAIPQYYDVREVLEVWPPPDESTYVIWLKGEIGPGAFANPDDQPAVDSRACFLHALANKKANDQQPDAQRYDRQLEILIGRYTAGTHLTKRYIPGEPPLVGMQRPIREVPGG